MKHIMRMGLGAALTILTLFAVEPAKSQPGPLGPVQPRDFRPVTPESRWPSTSKPRCAQATPSAQIAYLKVCILDRGRHVLRYYAIRTYTSNGPEGPGCRGPFPYQSIYVTSAAATEEPCGQDAVKQTVYAIRTLLGDEEAKRYTDRTYDGEDQIERRVRRLSVDTPVGSYNPDTGTTTPYPAPETPPGGLRQAFGLPSPFEGPFVGFGVRGLHAGSHLTERLNATGVVTNRFHPSAGAFALAIEGGYSWMLNPRMFAAMSVALTLTNARTARDFGGGAAFGSVINAYLTTTGQLGYLLAPTVAVFAEAGLGLANQRTFVTFAPADSRTQIVPGLVLGLGLKIALEGFQPFGKPALFTARYQYLHWASARVSPPGLFNYSAQTNMHTFRIGLEFPFGP